MPKELKSHNIILRNILIVLGLVIVAFITWMIFLNFIGSVTYEGLSFEVVSQGDLIFYKHVVPLYNGDAHYANYNFFLRKNPYKTGEIPFEGELNIRNFAAINTTAFTCEGKGIIAMANMVKPFEVAGIQVVNDQNASCDEESRYISHLKEELRKDGYIRDDKVIKTFALKKDFQDSKFYKETKVWYNKQIDNPNRKKKTLEDIKKSMEIDINARQLLNAQIKGKINISNDEVKKYYDGKEI